MRRPRTWLLAALAATAIALVPAAPASASFGFLPGGEGFGVSIENEDGSPDAIAGTHPYELHLKLNLNESGGLSEGDLRDLHLTLPRGVLVTPTVGECTLTQFHVHRNSPYQESLSGENCPDESQVGTVAVRSSDGGVTTTRWFGVFNVTPPAGAPEAIGFSPFGIPILIPIHVREADGALTLDLHNLSQARDIQGLELTFWGTPWATPTPTEWTFWHDNERGDCLNELNPAEPFGVPASPVPRGGPPPQYVPGTCSAGGDPRLYVPLSYLSLPTSCGQPMLWEARATSWQGGSAQASALSAAPVQCVAPNSVAEVQLYTESAAAATGLVFNLHTVDDYPLASAGRITSPAAKATMELPEGLTINPSLGSGLGVCTPVDFAREGPETAPGAGCPDNSKIGAVAVEGLLGLRLPPVKGSVYLAQPYANPSGSLIAIYMVIRDARRGIFMRSVGSVEPDPATGRLKTSFEGLPQLNYTRFTLTLREGQRSTMVSPPACGTYVGQLELTPYSDPSTRLHDLSFLHITKGEGGGPCPTGALQPFQPGLVAGALNSFAGAYTPFLLHMTRADGEQEITSYSATFPPGLLAKIAGVPYCSDAAIEAAKGRTGSEELASPSCPADTEIGRTLAGYGVGGTLAYAPGKLYLSGPYHGAPLSIVAIDSALVGPFDLGVVVVRSAIRIDPHTAQASIDSSGSDPIPHILKGIPIHLRDIRVYVDRPGFTLNPTSCDVLETTSTLTGAGRDLFSPADDVAAVSHDRFQLLGCPELGFRPRFGMKLGGSTKHGRYPTLRATYAPRPGQANAAYAQVTLPSSLFLAQNHIGTVCTSAQLASQSCPSRSVIGRARAVTPLMEVPMEGPVVLRSSSNPLPDVLADLHGRGFEVQVHGRIDSSHGGIRATFEVLPDAPVTKFTMRLFGGRRGLLQNAENLCARPQLFTARFAAHDNATETLRSPLATRCR